MGSLLGNKLHAADSGWWQGEREGFPYGHEASVLLTTAEMAQADQAAVDRGTSGDSLMEAAGMAVAEVAHDHWSKHLDTKGKKSPTAIVLCGPGNNGGDGFVAAYHLVAAGWSVTIALLGERGALKGHAAVKAEQWIGDIVTLEPAVLDGADLVIDAIFGAGLTRPLAGAAKKTIATIDKRRIPCIAVDIPSGIDGNTGEVCGAAAHATVTVTFFCRKPGHMLLPGRLHCGKVVVADIGIPHTVLTEINPRTFANDPSIWLRYYPWPKSDAHKYSRGHAIISGGVMTGAARLAARGALRCGAGLVSIGCDPCLVTSFAGKEPSVIVRTCSEDGTFGDLVSNSKVTAILVGPGNGVTVETQRRTLAALGTEKACVLDADALTVFEDLPEELFNAITGTCVLTPHEGEFGRLFGIGDARLVRAQEAAKKSGGHIVLKGPDTIVASPDGRVSINENAPPELATAGAGDVLAGFILALLAQGMPAFEAASAGVWLHGAVAMEFGPGLVAEDLPDCLPGILRQLKILA